MIERALERLGSLVNAARRLDEAAADLMKARLHRLDLADFARQMADAYDRLHAEQGLRVTARTGGPAMVAATEESLEAVLENLLDNALSFSPPAGTVRVTVAAAGDNIQLSVEDEGPGVPPEQLPRIFRRNYSHRPEEPGAVDDLPHFGIGLAVVRRNIELLGGRVSAENVAGAGLRVTVTLPSA